MYTFSLMGYWDSHWWIYLLTRNLVNHHSLIDTCPTTGGFNIQENGFRKISRAYPLAIVQCPIDEFAPLVLNAPNEAKKILNQLKAWESIAFRWTGKQRIWDRFSTRWTVGSLKSIFITYPIGNHSSKPCFCYLNQSLQILTFQNGTIMAGDRDKIGNIINTPGTSQERKSLPDHNIPLK